MNPKLNAPRISIWNRVGMIEGGMDMTPPNACNPKIMAMAVTARMPIRMAPRTLSASSPAMMNRPSTASSAPGAVRSPNATMVAGLPTTSPRY